MSYFSVTDTWIRPAKLLRAMLVMFDENNNGPLKECIAIYEEKANASHERWLKSLSEKGIVVEDNDPFRIPPFPNNQSAEKVL